MAKDKEIKVSYTLVNKGFNKAIKDIEGDVKKLNKEFALQKEQMKLSASGATKLEATLKNLNSRYELASRKTEEIRKALANAKKMFGENSEEAKKWSLKLLDAEKAEQKLKNEIEQTNVKLREAVKAESESARASKERLDKLKELSGEQEKLKSSSEKLKKEFELQTVSMSQNASETDKLKAKTEHLKKELDNSSKSVENLEKQLDISKKEYGENSVEVDRLEKELLEAKIAFKTLSNEVEANEKVLNKASSTLDTYSKKFDTAADKMKKKGDKVVGWGKTATTHLTAPVMAFSGASIAAFKDYDEGTDIIITKTGATGKSLDDMKNIYKGIISDMPVDAKVVGAAIGEVNTRFGVTDNTLNKLSRDFLMFSKLNNTDVSTSIDNTQKVMTAFGLKAEDTSAVLDLFNAVGQKTGISADVLAKSIIANNAAFQQMGFNLPQTANFLGQVEMSGADVSQVMTGLNKALTNAAAQGKPMKTALKEIQESMLNAKSDSEGLQVAIDLFGKKSGPAIYEACKSGKLSFDELSASLKDNVGNVSKTFNATMDNTDKFAVSMNRLKLVGAEVGESLLTVLQPVIEELAEILKKLLEKWKSLSPEMQQTIIKAALLAAAIGPVLIVLGNLIRSVSSILKLFSGLFKGLSLLSQAWKVAFRGAEAGSKGVSMLAKAFSGISKVISPLKGIIGRLFTSIGGAFARLLPMVSGALQSVVGIIMANPVAAAIAVAVAALVFIWFKYGDQIKAWFSKHWEGLKKTASDGMKNMLNDTKEAFSSMGEKISDTWNKIKDRSIKAWDTLKTAYNKYTDVKKKVTNAAEQAIGSYISNSWNRIKSNTIQSISNLSSSIRSGWNNISQATSSTWSRVSQGLSNSWNRIRSMANSAFGALRNTISSIWNNISGVTSNVWGGIRNRIAGAIEGIKSVVRNGLNAVSNFFRSIRFELPRIKLPHFRVSGNFSLWPPSVPHISVDWYKTGGIATGPNIVGIGEAGREAIVPIQNKRYMNPFADAIASRINSISSSGSIYITINQDVKETADFRKGIDLIDRELGRRGYRMRYATGGR